jgi:DNA polymerase III alpha subunit (gram-positive type)
VTDVPGSALLERDLVFLDCEMTGGDPERNEIIEIGAVRSRLPRLPKLEELGAKVAPRTMRGSSRSSVRIAHYSPAQWKGAIDIEPALQRLREFAQNSLLVGWATHHDLLFVNAAARRLGMEPFFADGYVELQKWAQARLRLAKTPGLQRVADQLKVVRDEEHSALEDALVTFEVFRILWRFSPDELERTLPELGWDSYEVLSGDIGLSGDAAAERAAEVAAYVITDTSPEALLRRLKS